MSDPTIYKGPDRRKNDVALEAIRRQLVSLGAALASVGGALNAEARFIARRRRSSIVLLLIAIVAGAYVVDHHSETCGPGARTEHVVQALVNGQVQSREDFNRIVAEGTPDDVCDATFPLHTHDPNDSWPTGANLLGFGVLAVLGVAGWIYVVRPDRRERRDPPRTVTEAVIEQEEGSP